MERKRPRLWLESWDALRTALPRKLLNSKLGSVPIFVDSSSVQGAALSGYSLTGVTCITEPEFVCPGFAP